MGRPDLAELFGVSPAQASSDLQRYQELNPGGMGYQMSRKRYEALPGMKCVMGEPQFELAVKLFLGGELVSGVGGDVGSDLVETVKLPVRPVKPDVERMIVQSLLGGWRVEIKYRGVRQSDRKSVGKRWVRPARLVWDGVRWHVRAWCELREAYRDFVMSRIVWAGVPVSCDDSLPADEEWGRWEVLELMPNPKVGEEGREALRLDYQLGKGGILKLKVRAALKQYLRERMGVLEGGGERQWVEVEGESG